MKKSSTVMAQLLQIISRYDFKKAVHRYKADKHAKRFSCWEQFVSLLYGQLAGCDSLRSITNNLSTVQNRLYHLGVKSVKRSTLSYANQHRSYRVFEDLFYALMEKVSRRAPKHSFRFNNPLYSIDTTTIDLCLSLYDWAKFRKTKGGIKLHTKLNHSGYLPEVVHVSKAQDNDQRHVDRFSFNEGDIVLFDRGFNDYSRFATYCNKKIYFVTRMKKNAAYKVVQRNDVSKYKYITSDQIITSTGYYSKKNCSLQLRRIRSRDPETGKAIVNSHEYSTSFC